MTLFRNLDREVVPLLRRVFLLPLCLAISAGNSYAQNAQYCGCQTFPTFIWNKKTGQSCGSQDQTGGQTGLTYSLANGSGTFEFPNGSTGSSNSLGQFSISEKVETAGSVPYTGSPAATVQLTCNWPGSGAIPPATYTANVEGLITPGGETTVCYKNAGSAACSVTTGWSTTNSIFNWYGWLNPHTSSKADFTGATVQEMPGATGQDTCYFGSTYKQNNTIYPDQLQVKSVTVDSFNGLTVQYSDSLGTVPWYPGVQVTFSGLTNATFLNGASVTITKPGTLDPKTKIGTLYGSFVHSAYGPTSEPKGALVTGYASWSVRCAGGGCNRYGPDGVGWSPAAVKFYRDHYHGLGLAANCGYIVYQQLWISQTYPQGTPWDTAYMNPNVLSGRITDTQVMSCRGGQWAVKNYYPPSSGYVAVDQNIVTWVSGGLFETGWEGGNININGTLYVVGTVISDTQLTLTSNAPASASTPYSVAAASGPTTFSTGACNSPLPTP